MSLKIQIWSYLKKEWTQRTFVGLEDVLKTSSRHILKTSSLRLHYVFSVTIFLLPRHLQDVLKASCEDVLKTSWKIKHCYAKDVFKTSWKPVVKTSWRYLLKSFWIHILNTPWRHVLKTSSRRLQGKQNVYVRYLYLANLNVYIFDLANLYLAILYLTNLSRTQNALIRTQ